MVEVAKEGVADPVIYLVCSQRTSLDNLYCSVGCPTPGEALGQG